MISPVEVVAVSVPLTSAVDDPVVDPPTGTKIEVKIAIDFP
jgi:hypothetical protein